MKGAGWLRLFKCAIEIESKSGANATRLAEINASEFEGEGEASSSCAMPSTSG